MGAVTTVITMLPSLGYKPEVPVGQSQNADAWGPLPKILNYWGLGVFGV